MLETKDRIESNNTIRSIRYILLITKQESGCITFMFCNLYIMFIVAYSWFGFCMVVSLVLYWSMTSSYSQTNLLQGASNLSECPPYGHRMVHTPVHMLVNMEKF
uniref:Uncharacterized protein n=1 Tax=Cacopsylla melanoneura TaxID=428564 RepID=A0A8D9EAF9_9HEMI